jgi:Secretion system C-terminal sorting domain
MRKLFSLLIITLPFSQSYAQQIIASQSFETVAPSNPMTYKITGTGGVAQGYSGMSPVEYVSSESPFYSEGSTGFGVCNTQRVIDFDPVNTTNYSNAKLSFNLAAFATTAGQGLELNDVATVSVSTDGVTYYKQIEIRGNSGSKQAYWDYSAAGIALTPFNTTNVPVVYMPDGESGDHNHDGFSLVEVTNLPQVATIYVRIVLSNTAINEIWVVDNVKLSGLQALPVEMSNFSVQCTGKEHLIEWITAYEEDVESFMVERGKTANQFEQISTVKPMGAGGYTFTDANPFNGTTYYRLKVMDKDGQYTYSKVASASINNSKWRIYPTVTESYIVLEKQSENENVTVNVFDISGRTVLTQLVRGEETNVQLDLNNLTKGVYFIKINDRAEKFMKM